MNIILLSVYTVVFILAIIGLVLELRDNDLEFIFIVPSIVLGVILVIYSMGLMWVEVLN